MRYNTNLVTVLCEGLALHVAKWKTSAMFVELRASQ